MELIGERNCDCFLIYGLGRSSQVLPFSIINIHQIRDNLSNNFSIFANMQRNISE